MSRTKIRGNTQIIAGTITDAEINASANIATTKLANGPDFIQRGGSVAFTADQSLGGNKLTNLGAPSAATDAARLQDVVAAVNGLQLKFSVRVASTANIDLSSALIDSSVIDGVTVATGDRVLLKDQTDATENGIYLVVASGAASRSPDADNSPAGEVTANMFTYVEEGTLQHDTGWALITDNPITLGTTPLTFTQFSGSSSVTGAANVGAGSGQVFKGLNVSTLEFRTLKQGAAGKVTITNNTNDITLDIGAGTLVDADVSATAAISRSKIAAGSANHVVINDGSGNLSSEAVLAVSRGGTNSGTALNNNRIIVSSGGAIVESAAITANRALASNGSGIPVATAVTDTELGFLSGVTSSVQTQLNARQEQSKIIVREVPSGAVDGSNVTFTLAHVPAAGKESVYLNGELQQSGGSADYTISSDTITFNSPAPASGDILLVSYVY